MKISPALAVVLGIFFGCLFGLKAWTGFKWRGYQGPDYVAQDNQGNLYIAVKSKILRYNAKGEFAGERDLAAFGVHQLVGNISFFPNGDLLLLPQDYNLSTFERILVRYRITPQKDSPAATSQLSRCKWEPFGCEQLPHFSEPLRRAFWTFIDAEENIFLADTTHHRLLWLDSEGKLLDEFENKEELQFPNQLYRRDNQLWFANCNDNSVSYIELGDKKFGKKLNRFKADRLVERWPTGLVWTGKSFIALVQGNNLSKGSLYEVDEERRSLSRIQKTKIGDFISIGFYQDKILAADYRAVSIRQFDLDGAPLPDLVTPEFGKIASEFKAKQRMWKRFESLAESAFWGALIIGFALAIWLEKKHKDKQPEGFERPEISVNYKRHIQWISYKPLKRNITKWSIWLLSGSLLLIFPALFSAEEESVFYASITLVLHGIILLSSLQAYRLSKIEIGAAVPWVYLRGLEKRADGTRKEEMFHESDIQSFSLWGLHVLMIGKHHFLAKSGKKAKLFNNDLANEYIERLLQQARPMSLVERFQWVLTNRLSEFMWALLLALLYCVAFFILQVVR